MWEGWVAFIPTGVPVPYSCQPLNHVNPNGTTGSVDASPEEGEARVFARRDKHRRAIQAARQAGSRHACE
jgi:hypothetical protein